MDNNYFDARYDSVIKEGNSNKLILYIDEKENTNGVTINSLRDAYQYLNDILLEQDIHLDFNKTRNNVTYQDMMKSVSRTRKSSTEGRNPMILLAEGDIGATVENQIVTYFINVKTNANTDNLIARLNNSFKPNNDINSLNDIDLLDNIDILNNINNIDILINNIDILNDIDNPHYHGGTGGGG